MLVTREVLELEDLSEDALVAHGDHYVVAAVRPFAVDRFVIERVAKVGVISIPLGRRSEGWLAIRVAREDDPFCGEVGVVYAAHKAPFGPKRRAESLAVRVEGVELLELDGVQLERARERRFASRWRLVRR